MQDGEEAYHGLILFDASSQWLEEFEEFESAPFTSGAHSDRTPIVIKNSFQSLDEGERKVEECLQCRGVEVGAKRQSGEFSLLMIALLKYKHLYFLGERKL